MPVSPGSLALRGFLRSFFSPVGRTALRLRLRTALGRELAIFEADWTGLYPFIRPLVIRMARDPSPAIAVMTRSSEVAGVSAWLERDLAPDSADVSVIPFDVIDSVPLMPSILISCQPYSRVAHRFTDIPKIQLLHGIADKRGELFGPRNLSDFTHLFSPAPVVSELARERLFKDVDMKASPIEIVDIGCPKTDDLFDGTYRRDKVLRGLDLPTDPPAVLYAPTWEKEASFEQHGEQIVSEVAAVGVSLMVKPHPLTLADPKDRFLIDEGHGGKDWRATLRAWEDRFPNVRWVRDPYANPYLVAADLLLTEGSGIAFEYALLDKPIIFIDTPMVSERYGTDNLHHRLRGCGETASTIDEIPKLIEINLDQPDRCGAPRKDMIDQLAYNRGVATDSACSKIASLLRH